MPVITPVTEPASEFQVTWSPTTKRYTFVFCIRPPEYWRWVAIGFGAIKVDTVAGLKIQFSKNEDYAGLVVSNGCPSAVNADAG